jgi:hypothetical protein
MSLIATLLKQRREYIAARDEAAVHRFEVVLEKLKSNNDLNDAMHYGVRIAHGDAGDAGVLRKVEFSKDDASVVFVVRDDGQTYINGMNIGDMSADSTHKKLCELIVDALLV